MSLTRAFFDKLGLAVRIIANVAISIVLVLSPISGDGAARLARKGLKVAKGNKKLSYVIDSTITLKDGEVSYHILKNITSFGTKLLSNFRFAHTRHQKG